MSTIPKIHSFQSTEFQPTLSSHLIFELKSFLGRVFLRLRPPTLNGAALLQVGCGENRFDGWCNADFFVFNPRTPKPEWMLDMRYPLLCESNYWDGVYTEHALEHLYP